jgi:hypothetical protein
VNVPLRMHELTATPVSTELLSMKLITGLGHVVRGKMRLFYQLIFTVRVRAIGPPLTLVV